MTQMRTTLGGRIARLALWVGLLVLPLLYCLLLPALVVVAAGVPESYGDIYIAGQALPPVVSPSPTWADVLRAGATLACVTWPVLLAAGAGYLVLAAGRWLGRRYWPRWQLWPARTPWQLAGQLLGLLAVAYAVGCLVHLLLPNVLLHPAILLDHGSLAKIPDSLVAELTPEEYWWPYVRPSAAALRGFTSYSPTYAAELEFHAIKADCIKLGALLATLALYRRSHSRTSAAPSAA